MKAYLIDPFAREISEVEHNGNFRQIYELIQSPSQSFSAVRMNGRGDMIYVDEEGLFVPFDRQEFFGLRGYGAPLAGRGLVLGSDPYGESVSPKASLDEVRGQIVWLGKDVVRRYSESGVFDTHVTSLTTGETARYPFRPYGGDK
jgi:hypothetical protein